MSSSEGHMTNTTGTNEPGQDQGMDDHATGKVGMHAVIEDAFSGKPDVDENEALIKKVDLQLVDKEKNTKGGSHVESQVTPTISNEDESANPQSVLVAEDKKTPETSTLTDVLNGTKTDSNPKPETSGSHDGTDTQLQNDVVACDPADSTLPEVMTIPSSQFESPAMSRVSSEVPSVIGSIPSTESADITADSVAAGSSVFESAASETRNYDSDANFIHGSLKAETIGDIDTDVETVMDPESTGTIDMHPTMRQPMEVSQPNQQEEHEGSLSKFAAELHSEMQHEFGVAPTINVKDFAVIDETPGSRSPVPEIEVDGQSIRIEDNSAEAPETAGTSKPALDVSTAVEEQTERPKSPWTPSYAVTTVGRGITGEAPKLDPATQLGLAKETLESALNEPETAFSDEPKNVEPEEMVKAVEPTASQESALPERPKSPYPQSYSVSRQGSRSDLGASYVRDDGSLSPANAAHIGSSPTEPEAIVPDVLEALHAVEPVSLKVERTEKEALPVTDETSIEPVVSEKEMTTPLIVAEEDVAPRSPYLQSYSVSRQGSRSNLRDQISADRELAEGEALLNTGVDPSKVSVAAQSGLVDPIVGGDAANLMTLSADEAQHPVSSAPPILDGSQQEIPAAPAEVDHIAENDSHVEDDGYVADRSVTSERPVSPYPQSYSVSRQGSRSDLTAYHSSNADISESIGSASMDRETTVDETSSVLTSDSDVGQTVRQHESPVEAAIVLPNAAEATPKSIATQTSHDEVPKSPYIRSYSVSRQGSRLNLRDDFKQGTPVTNTVAPSIPSVNVEESMSYKRFESPIHITPPEASTGSLSKDLSEGEAVDEAQDEPRSPYPQSYSVSRQGSSPNLRLKDQELFGPKTAADAATAKANSDFSEGLSLLAATDSDGIVADSTSDVSARSDMSEAAMSPRSALSSITSGFDTRSEVSAASHEVMPGTPRTDWTDFSSDVPAIQIDTATTEEILNTPTTSFSESAGGVATEDFNATTPLIPSLLDFSPSPDVDTEHGIREDPASRDKTVSPDLRIHEDAGELDGSNEIELNLSNADKYSELSGYAAGDEFSSTRYAESIMTETEVATAADITETELEDLHASQSHLPVIGNAEEQLEAQASISPSENVAEQVQAIPQIEETVATPPVVENNVSANIINVPLEQSSHEDGAVSAQEMDAGIPAALPQEDPTAHARPLTHEPDVQDIEEVGDAGLDVPFEMQADPISTTAMESFIEALSENEVQDDAETVEGISELSSIHGGSTTTVGPSVTSDFPASYSVYTLRTNIDEEDEAGTVQETIDDYNGSFIDEETVDHDPAATQQMPTVEVEVVEPPESRSEERTTPEVIMPDHASDKTETQAFPSTEVADKHEELDKPQLNLDFSAVEDTESGQLQDLPPRQRLDSIKSIHTARFFPGGWVASPPAPEPDPMYAQGEFAAPESPTTGREQKRWCIIM